MKQTKHKSENNNFIAFDDLVSRLGLLEIDVHSWLIRDQPKVKRDYRGRLLIPLEYLERYSTSIDYKNAFNRAVAAEKSLRESERSQTASS